MVTSRTAQRTVRDQSLRSRAAARTSAGEASTRPGFPKRVSAAFAPSRVGASRRGGRFASTCAREIRERGRGGASSADRFVWAQSFLPTTILDFIRIICTRYRSVKLDPDLTPSPVPSWRPLPRGVAPDRTFRRDPRSSRTRHRGLAGRGGGGASAGARRGSRRLRFPDHR